MPIKNNKIYKWTGILAIVLLFVFSVIYALKNPSSNTNQQNLNSGQPTMDISTNQGDVEINDVTKNPVFDFNGDMVVKENSNYHILYFSKDQSFLITILAQPVRQSRQQAENAFLTLTGLDAAGACKLKVSLTVPNDVDQNLSGQEWGLSFCPNGKPFPQ
ncbi:MAG: hypothetical protein M1383_05535 [Patescibacteria group bacterium]|nr:hypothetical protein [Patescibacteria group bacterium]